MAGVPVIVPDGMKTVHRRGGLLPAGYVWAGIIRVERTILPELMKFHRSEQMKRVQEAFRIRTL
jgi:hypothetical protein